jgi:hypothetical protein
MKQKRINDILYVFDITPYQITEDIDAEVIKVQEECVVGFKELNESLVDKIVAYNYHIACVQVPEWAPYVDEQDPTPKENPELSWSAESATVTIGADDNVFPTLTNPHNVTVTYASDNSEIAAINENTGEITLVSTGAILIYAIFAGDDTYEAQTVTYTLIVQESAQPTVENITYQHWGDSSLQDYDRFMAGTGETQILNTDANYYNNFILTVGSTDYTFDPSNEDQDGYIWDDTTDKNVAIKNNIDAKWPDVYVPVVIAGTDPDWISITAVYTAPGE